jgi:uncharacterized membrane protein
MENIQHNEHRRTQFQIDRIAFFSDAVIAIAITLMILEIKIPAFGKDASLEQVLSKYGGNMTLHIIALLICYLSIGNLWIRHHELFEHIINYNKNLIKVNLYFLLTIMLLPVSVSFMFEPNNPPQMQTMVFFINLFLCNLTYYLMLRVIYNSKNKFSSIDGTEAAQKSKRIAFHVTVMFLMVIIVAIFWRHLFFIPFIVWPFVARIAERIRNKNKKNAMS